MSGNKQSSPILLLFYVHFVNTVKNGNVGETEVNTVWTNGTNHHPPHSPPSPLASSGMAQEEEELNPPPNNVQRCLKRKSHPPPPPHWFFFKSRKNKKGTPAISAGRGGAPVFLQARNSAVYWWRLSNPSSSLRQLFFSIKESSQLSAMAQINLYRSLGMSLSRLCLKGKRLMVMTRGDHFHPNKTFMLRESHYCLFLK